MLIQILPISSVAAAQEVLCARAHIAASVTRWNPAPRGLPAVRTSFKPTVEIYPAVTLCLIDVRGLCSMPGGETATGRELAPRRSSEKFPKNSDWRSPPHDGSSPCWHVNGC
jgi:hypothetical protein